MRRAINFFICVSACFASVSCNTDSNRDESNSIVGCVWHLQRFGENGSLEEPLVNTHITLSFENDSIIHGNGGCNEFLATYQIVEPDSLSITMRIRSAESCDNQILEQEEDYFTFLIDVKAFSLFGDTLSLNYGNSGNVLIFSR